LKGVVAQNEIPRGYSDTPTPLPPPPRRVKKEKGVLVLPLFLMTAVLVSLAIGIIFLKYAVEEILWLTRGQTVIATVTRAEMVHVSRSKNSHYDAPCLFYKVTVDGVEYTGHDIVVDGTYDKYSSLSKPEDCCLPVLFYKWGWFQKVGIQKYDLSVFWVYIAVCGLGSLLLILISAFFVFIFSDVLMIMIKNIMWSDKIYTHGIAVAGIVINRKADKSKKYLVKLEYKSKNGKSFSLEDEVTPMQWVVMPEGQHVTVLYDPNDPSSHVIYEESGVNFLTQ
jgi:hypothetical protein